MTIFFGVQRYTAVNAHVETFLYGGEEPFDATPEEVAYFFKRIERQPDFIESRTEKIGESDFKIFNLLFLQASAFLLYCETYILSFSPFSFLPPPCFFL